MALSYLIATVLEHCICCKSLNLINQFSFPVFTAFSKWCRFAMDHNLSWDIWHDKLDQAREGREKWNLYQKQTKQKFHLMMLLSTLSSSFRIEFYNRHLNHNINLALIRFDSLYILSIKLWNEQTEFSHIYKRVRPFECLMHATASNGYLAGDRTEVFVGLCTKNC